MQITLNQEEIENALIDYVRSTISIADNFSVAVDLKAGRGEHGYAATLDITKNTSKPAATTALAPRATRLTKASKAEVDEVILDPDPELDPEPETVEDDQTEEISDETDVTTEEVAAATAADGEGSKQSGSIFSFNA